MESLEYSVDAIGKEIRIGIVFQKGTQDSGFNRARRREEDVHRVSGLIKHCKREDRFALLRRTFPARPAKSILYVMRQAEKFSTLSRSGARRRHRKPVAA